MALIKVDIENDTETIKELLQKKDTDVNSQNKQGIIALILASEHGHTEIVKELMKRPGTLLYPYGVSLKYGKLNFKFY